MRKPFTTYFLVIILLVGTSILQAGKDTTGSAADALASESFLSDRDRDGIADHMDRCPDTPSVAKVASTLRIASVFGHRQLMDARTAVAVDATGCALDSDGDGVADHGDFCAEDTPQEISSGVGKNGCPLQSDGDGTPDYRDACPGTPLGVAVDSSGCKV